MGIGNRNAPAPDVSPVSVESCDVRATTDNAIVSRSGGITIAFANDANTVADLIRFRVTFARHEATIRDVGKFVPGVTVRHRFRDTRGYYGSPLFDATPTCTVEAVHFIDGTTWLAHGTPPAPTPNAAASSAP